MATRRDCEHVEGQQDLVDASKVALSDAETYLRYLGAVCMISELSLMSAENDRPHAFSLVFHLKTN
jgi:hypothetical protein